MHNLETLLQTAITHHKQGHLQAANKIYDSILTIQANHPEALYLKALIIYEFGQYTESKQLLQQAISIKADYCEAYIALGDLFTQMGLFEESNIQYCQAIQLSPDNYQLLIKIGNNSQLNNQILKAIDYYKKSLQLFQSAEGHYNLAKAYWQLKDESRTIYHYKASLDIQPDYINASLNLANVYTMLKEYIQAIKVYQQAIQYQPTNAQLYCYLGHVLQLSEQSQLAIENYQLALELDPENSDYHTYLANSFEISKQWESALKHYRLAILSHSTRRMIPPILFNTLPKSGSMYIWSTLCNSLGLEQFYISQGKFVNDVISPWLLKRLALGGSISQAHLFPSPENLNILNQYLKKWIIHIRDPRQACLSWVYHLDHLFTKGTEALETGLDIGTALPSNYFKWSFEQKIDWNIEYYFPLLVKWIHDWYKISHNNNKIVFSFYEEFHDEPTRFFNQLLQHFDIDPALYNQIILQPRTKSMHYRKGQKDEWRQVLTPKQQINMSQMIPEELYQAFHWSS